MHAQYIKRFFYENLNQHYRSHTEAKQLRRVCQVHESEIKMYPMPFSVGDIVRFCEYLEKNGELDRLSRFLWSLPYSIKEIFDSESIAVFRAIAAFHIGNFHELYRILEGRPLSETSHAKLQRLWFKARYVEAEKYRKRSLDAVAKYRIRRKYPSPKTISTGREKSYCFQEKTRKFLNEVCVFKLGFDRFDYTPKNYKLF